MDDPCPGQGLVFGASGLGLPKKKASGPRVMLGRQCTVLKPQHGSPMGRGSTLNPKPEIAL